MEARRRLVAVDVDGKRAWALAEDEPALLDEPKARGGRLLPKLDPLNTSRDRELLVPDPALRRPIWKPSAARPSRQAPRHELKARTAVRERCRLVSGVGARRSRRSGLLGRVVADRVQRRLRSRSQQRLGELVARAAQVDQGVVEVALRDA